MPYYRQDQYSKNAGDKSLSEALRLNQNGVSLACARQTDEAISVLKRALAVKPNLATTHHNLGAVYMMCNNLDKAIDCYNLAIQLDGSSPRAHFNLANIYRSKGKTDDAVRHLRRVIELNPKHHSAGHILAASIGATPERAPAEFVKQLFDQYAVDFEDALVRDLHYQTPAQLNSLVREYSTTTVRLEHALDMGCGTGLAGMEFTNSCQRLTGVDLSPKMIELAEDKKVYSALVVDDIFAFLRTTAERFDLFIASDVFNYCGNLGPIFDGIRRCAREQAYLVFSTEEYAGEGFALATTGRYQHSKTYVLDLAEKSSIEVLGYRTEVIRKDHDELVHGDLFLCKL